MKVRRWVARGAVAVATAVFVVLVMTCLGRLSDHDAGQQSAIAALQDQVRSLGAEPVAGPTPTAGPSGRDGRDGKDGTDGTNTVTVITVPGPTVEGPTGPESTVPGPTGPAGPQGPQGPQGASGTPGTNGVDGANGQPGQPGLSAYPFTFTIFGQTFVCSSPLTPCEDTTAETARK